MATGVALETGLVRAAGCIVWRPGGGEPKVLLVHRPRYDDWSFPKGKLDPGETDIAAAVREVAEETGLVVGLGPRLPDQHYTIATGQPKVVAYWAARSLHGDDISSYRRNDEIDDLEWVTVSRAKTKISHPRDAEILDSFAESGFTSSPLLVVRHAQARSRKAWRGDDSERPLRADGRRQSEQLVSLLGSYGVSRIISSDAARCVDTVLPYLNATQARISLDSALSQDNMHRGRIARQVGRAMNGDKRIALCSHRPVLPVIFEAIGVDPVKLDPAGVVVVHRDQGKVVAVEQH
ncbi:MAG: NUDIX hydrolase [Propionibacteriales bacterium]|nr:NUDIX hydrolase [Propionibacteriales bacterium]